MKMRTQFNILHRRILMRHRCTLFALHKKSSMLTDIFKLSVATLANKSLFVGVVLFVKAALFLILIGGIG